MSMIVAQGDGTGAPKNLPVMLPAGGDSELLMTTEAVLQQELDHFGAPPCDGATTSRQTRADETRLAALCLSGGGIRSATFCLGALQAFAGRHMLREFHYLSTVSGGGFAGGWLQMFIRQHGGVEAAEDALNRAPNESFAKLREYTNYLTPEVGLLSKDSWAGIVLYIRNTALNWLVILPLLLFVPLALITYRTALEAARAAPWWLPLLFGSASLLVATFCACIMLPSHRANSDGRTPNYASPRLITLCIVFPTCAWALAVPFTLRALLQLQQPVESLWLSILSFAYLVVQFAAYFGGAAWQWSHKDQDGLRLYRKNIGPWLIASIFSAALIWAGTRFGLSQLLVGDAKAFNSETAQVAQPLTVLAPLGLVIAHLIQSVVFIGLRRTAQRADLDREWVARVDGQILLAGVGWTVLCLCCLVLPALVLDREGLKLPALVSSIGALLAGPVTAFLGKQVFTRAQSLAAKGRTDDLIVICLGAMATLFGVGLFAVMGWSLGEILGRIGIWWGDCGLPRTLLIVLDLPNNCGFNPYMILLVIQFTLVFLLTGAIWLFGRVNVNRFSMHGVYRNRLSRGFLGSARVERNADPFTDFDEQDSPRIAELKDRRRLFPVINVTLNLTDILRTAWAERKAASFTATPLACGSAILDRADMPNPDRAPKSPRGAYVRTDAYACKETHADDVNAKKGPLLSSFLTISGAAVSPNWGYHSSRLIAFLMTLFNVRLGAWLPNPAVAKLSDLELAKPSNSVVALLNELSGRSTDVRQAVYLSDGGHFDNLGLYEMLRRRCARIVVIDAGQDEACTFFDLGNVIRKAEVDGLAKVQMGEMRILTRTTIEQDGKRAGALGYARGTITYPGARDPATLIYVKPSFLQDIPAEIRAYGATSPAFPHESTANQWFSESQFESYRALGFHQISGMFGSQLTTLSEWANYLESEINRRTN